MPEQPNGQIKDASLGKMAQDLRDAGGRIGTAVGAVAGREIDSAVEETKKAGLAQVQELTGTAQKVADDLQAQAPMLADYIRDAAKQVERMGESIRERSVGELLQKATEYGRQQPMLFFAGAAIMGFALARFVKSGLPAEGHSGTDTGMSSDTGYSSGTGYPTGTGYSASPDDRDAVTNATGINV